MRVVCWTAGGYGYTVGMKIEVNGQVREAPNGQSVAALIEAEGLGSRACAAEVNKKLVPKKEHGSCVLGDGDVVELVTLVGGG